MKCTIPEISWHNREPVLSVDIHPQSNECYRLASGGGDSHVLIWQMVLTENGAVKQEVISDLTRHQRAVNCVRWSPTGQYLASADDDANIIIWQLKNDNIPLLEGDSGDKETWIVHKILRGHKEDIYDLCWSLDSTKLFSGSIDNTAILWDLKKGKLDHILTDHKGFVQGVTWDPKNQLLASISTDRMCRLFDITGKQVKARIHKGKLPVSKNHFLYDKEVKYFHDDTFKSFFRRLQFSPDGSLLIVPSGHMEADDCKKVLNATLIFTLDDWSRPLAVLPIPKQCSTVVRFCPVLFKLHDDGPEPIIKLPYRMIFAIGTDHDVILYDTQQCVPFARFHEIHYTRLTDITWSKDGLLLTASSTDGFCALITFEPDELGKIYNKEQCELEQNSSAEVSACEEVDKDENVDINNQIEKEVKKKPSFIEKWALNTPNMGKKGISEKAQECIEISDTEEEEDVLSKEVKDEINKLIPRRSSFKKTEDPTGGAKPIEIRRKPRGTGEISNSEKSIAKLIEVRRQPREEIDNAHNVNSEVKLIEVRRKSRQEIDTTKKNYSEAKPIEVRRKPKEQTEAKSIEVKWKPKESLEVKPIEVRKKPRVTADENCIIEHSTDNKAIDDNSSISDNTNKEIVKTNRKSFSMLEMDEKELGIKSLDEMNEKIPNETDGKVKVSKTNKGTENKLSKTSISNNIDITPPVKGRLSLKNTDDKKSTSKRKKDETPKAKSARKKLCTTPPKSSTLLNFFKGKQTVGIEKIDLTMEEEARDAWVDDRPRMGGEPEEESLGAVPMEEDCTEDFCLQLEDTQESRRVDPCADKKIIQSGIIKTTEMEKSINSSKCDTCSSDEYVKNETTKSEGKFKIDPDIIHIDDSNEAKVMKVEDKKVPRRVPLITLASPKGNKKQKS